MLEATDVSSSTLANHLNSMKEDGLIELVLIDEKPHYRIFPDEDYIFEELKRVSYDQLLNIIRQLNPELAIITNLSLKISARMYAMDIIQRDKGLPPISYKEKDDLINDWVEELLSEEEYEILKNSKHKFIRNNFEELLRAFMNVRYA